MNEMRTEFSKRSLVLESRVQELHYKLDKIMATLSLDDSLPQASVSNRTKDLSQQDVIAPTQLNEKHNMKISSHKMQPNAHWTSNTCKRPRSYVNERTTQIHHASATVMPDDKMIENTSSDMYDSDNEDSESVRVKHQSSYSKIGKSQLQKIRRNWRRRHRSPSPPAMQTFHGEATKWRTFIFQFKQMANSCGWTSHQKVEKLIACMRDKAVEYLETLSPDMLYEYQNLVQELNRRYSHKEPARVCRYQLCFIQQKEGEYLNDYADRVQMLATDGYPGVAAHSVQSIAVDAFFRGCKDKLAAMIVMGSKPCTLSQAVSRLEDAVQDQIFLGITPSVDQDCIHKSSAPASTATTNLDENLENMVTKVVLKALDVKNNSQTDTPPTRSKFQKTCFACGFNGHFARECPHRPHSKSSVDKHKPIYCFHCGQYGHFARACEQPPRDSKWSSAVPSNQVSGYSSRETWKNHEHNEEKSMLQQQLQESSGSLQNRKSHLKSNKEEGNNSDKKWACDQANDVSVRLLCSACSMRSSIKAPQRK